MTEEYYIIKESTGKFGELFYGREGVWVHEVKQAKEFATEELADFYIANNKIEAKTIKIRAKYEIIEDKKEG